MEEIKIKIEDGSGDKSFFTIIPNYIANHSVANDQSLYFQMKRYAGENGKCFATEKTLMRKMGIGKKAYNKALNYLIEKGWISFIGLTGGKTRPIKTYKINNIWKLNSEYKEKISAESNISFKEKISAESSGDKCQKQHKISAESTLEEEQYKEEPLIRISSKEDTGKPVPSYGNKDINTIYAFLKEKLGGTPDGSQKENRRFAYLLFNKFKKDYPDKNPVELVKFLIEAGLGDNFHGKNITNFKYLYYHSQAIIQSIKIRIKDNNKIVAIL